MSDAVFGSSYNEAAGRGGWMGGNPDLPNQRQSRTNRKESANLRWAKNTIAVLKRERQSVTEQMKNASALAAGELPWWRGRQDWKMRTKLNSCATVPLTWTGLLMNAIPDVTYTTYDKRKQKRADIATAAWNQASTSDAWTASIHDAILVSQVQKKGYLTIRPHLMGDTITPRLVMFKGEQVYVDQNARRADKAEILLIEYRESYGSLIHRFPGLEGQLKRKYAPHRDHNGKNSVLAPSATYSFSGLNPGGNSPTVTTPAYGGSSNPPNGASGSGGMLVQELWTKPHKTIDIDEVQFLTTGEPATRPKMYETVDPNDEEPLRRVVTEAGVIYELPQSIVDALHAAEDNGGIRLTSDRPALEAVTHEVKYPLYPKGRLTVIVDEDLEADDRMNPLGYTIREISANADPGGGYYGPSSVDLIADAYEAKIRLVSTLADNANLMGNNIWRVWEGEPLSNDDFTNAPGGITRETLQSLRYSKREAAPDVPNYIMNMLKYYDDQIDKLSGLSDMLLGKAPPKMQVSTETETMRQEASGVRPQDAQANVAECMRGLGEDFLEFMARFYTTPVIVQVKNNAGVFEPTPMLGAYLTDPFITEARAGSRQPKGPTQQLTTLLQMKQAGIPVLVETVYDRLEEVGAIPSATQAMRDIEKVMMKIDPTGRWKVLGLPPPPGQNQGKAKSKGGTSGNKPPSKSRAGAA